MNASGPEDSHPETSIDRHVEQFVRLMEEDEAPELEEFLQSLPEGLRDEVRDRCQEVVHVRDILHQEARETRAPGVGAGQRLGEFKLLRVLGRGANGVVYLARQDVPAREVAVKVLQASLAAPRRFERFRRESQAAGRLQHPGIARILAVGHEGDIQYYAMEYVDGESLDARLDRMKGHTPESGSDAAAPGWAAQAAELLMNVAEALQYAHERGVVHRDIKPHNIVLGQDLRPRLVDFGLAKDVEETESLTRTGDFAGTPFYMSPEQIRKKRSPIDHRTDVYSLGVVLYEMLTLRRPFRGDTVQQVFDAISFKSPQPIRKQNPKVPRDLEVICHKAMEKNPDHRYATAGQLADDLRRFVHHESIQARPPSPVALAARYLSHRKREMAAVATAVVLTVLVFNLYDLFTSDRRADALTRSLTGEIEAEIARVHAARLLEWKARLEQLLEEYPDRVGLRDQQAAVEKRARQRIAEIEDQLGARDESAPSAFPETRKLGLAIDLGMLRQAFLLDAAEDGPRVPSFVTVEVEGGVPADLEMWVPNPLTGDPGQPLALGPTMQRTFAVPAGEVRLVVRGADGSYAECTRLLRPFDRTETVRVHLRPTDDVTRDMVHVKAGPFAFGVEQEQWPHLNRQFLELPDFWIDRHEVTNHQFREFVEATGHAEPQYFDLVDFERHGDCAVVGVTWNQARAYAEWAGKRLPTMFEFDKALFGNAEGLTPWGTNDVPGEMNLFRVSVDAGGEADLRVTRSRHLDEIWPNDRTPNDDVSHCGAMNLFGNVREWTESMYFTHTALGPRPSLQTRIQRGEYFKIESNYLSSQGLRSLHPKGTDEFSPGTGFRCAKSDLR